MEKPFSKRVWLVAGKVFGLLAAFLLVTLVYEWAAYRGYLSLYRRNGIRLVARLTAEAMARPGTEAERLARLEEIAAEAMKDPAVADVWFTDADFRLLYSADSRLRTEFGGQRLPAGYYPLYREGFGADGSRVVERGDLERGYAHVVAAVRFTGMSAFDLTVGMKLRKVSFLAVQDPFLVTRWFSFHPGVVAAWGGMLVLAFFVAWRVGWLAGMLFQEALQTVDRFGGAVGTTGEGVVATSGLMAPLAERLAELARVYEVRMREMVAEVERRTEEGCEAAVRRAAVPVLLPRPEGALPGLEYAVLDPSEGSVLSAVKDLGGFRSLVLVASCGVRRAPEHVAVAGLLRVVVERQAAGVDLGESLVWLNGRLRAMAAEALPVAAAVFGLSDGILSLRLAGWSGVLYHRGRSGETMVFPGFGTALGKRPDEDFMVGLREERLRMESGDTLLFFDGRLLEAVGVEGMKVALAAGGGAVEVAERLGKAAGAVAGSVFCLVVRKT